MRGPLYSNLDQLMWGYFNEDSELWGETVPEIVSEYNNGINSSTRAEILKEIDSLMSENERNLDEYFDLTYGSQFSPEPWGYTTASFLEEVKGILDSK
jgi:hypothetical protein